MKTKIFLTSILAISFAMPAMAEITSGATCNTENLGQSENNSTANVEAIWNAKTYMVRYRHDNTDSFISDSSCSLRNMESGKCDTATYDESFSFPMNDFLMPIGYTFNGWSCVDKDNNTTIYSGGQTILNWNIDSGLDCTAQWNANTINIDWYNGDTRVAQNSCVYDSTITLPEQPTKTGYTFNGWLLHDDCPDLTTENACDTNNKCLWNPNESKCLNAMNLHKECFEIGVNDCETVSYCSTTNHFDQNGNPACGLNACAFYQNNTKCEERNCKWDNNTCRQKTISDLLG